MRDCKNKIENKLPVIGRINFDFSKLVLILCLSIFGINFTSAQDDEIATGMIFEDEEYDQIKRLNPMDGSKSDLPPAISLEKYCPTVRNQGEIFSCVGWSVGYGAMTIQRSILNDCKDKKTIDRNAHSALFLYNQIKEGDCKRGSKITNALTFLTESGNCLASQFDFDVNDCEKAPDTTIAGAARKYSIEDYMTLFGAKDDPKKKVFQVKKMLASRRPVIIGMSVKRNFYELKDAKFWHPDLGKTTPAGGHAMVVVGYDDRKGAFRIFNSWGKGWGDNGLIWVKYKDFGKYTKYGYVLYLLPKPMLARMVYQRRKKAAVKKRKRIKITEENVASVKDARSQLENELADDKARRNGNRGNNQSRNSLTANSSGGNSSSNVGKADRIEASASDIKKEQERIKNKRTRNSGSQTKPRNKPNPRTRGGYDKTAEIIENPESVELAEDEELVEVMMEDAIVERPLIHLSGDFNFKNFIGWNEFLSPPAPKFEEASVKLEGNVYKTNELWKIGQKFQLMASTQNEEQYLYVFSIDGEQKVHFHWPRHKGLNEKFAKYNEPALIFSDGSEVSIPGKNKVLTLQKAGTDRLVVLFSKRKVRGLKKLAQLSASKGGNFMKEFLNTLGSYAVPQSDIQYYKDRIGFEASTRSEGYIVPLVLEVTTE